MELDHLRSILQLYLNSGLQIVYNKIWVITIDINIISFPWNIKILISVLICKMRMSEK